MQEIELHFLIQVSYLSALRWQLSCQTVLKLVLSLRWPRPEYGHLPQFVLSLSDLLQPLDGRIYVLNRMTALNRGFCLAKFCLSYFG